MIGRVLQHLGQLAWPIWLLVLAVTAGTNALDFLAAPPPGERPDAAFAAAAAVRVGLVLWLGYFLVRRFAGTARPGRIGMPFFRFTLYSLAVAAVMGLCAFLARRLVETPQLQVVLAGLLFAALTLALIRLLAWQAALAAGDRALGAGGAWRNLADCHGALAVAYLPVVPLALLHSGLTMAAVRTPGGMGATLGLALVDGAVSGLQIAYSCALAAFAWKLARERAALPAAGRLA